MLYAETVLQKVHDSFIPLGEATFTYGLQRNFQDHLVSRKTKLNFTVNHMIKLKATTDGLIHAQSCFPCCAAEFGKNMWRPRESHNADFMSQFLHKIKEYTCKHKVFHMIIV